jgi:hypothetical protein
MLCKIFWNSASSKSISSFDLWVPQRWPLEWKASMEGYS